MTELVRKNFDALEPLRRLLEGDVGTTWPKVEEYLDGNTRVIRMELPGLDPENDVDLSVVNNTLRLRAHRKEQSEHKDKDSYRSEFRYGSFSRVLPLPEDCKDDDITATYRDGVLEVRAPQPEASELGTTKKIKVTRG